MVDSFNVEKISQSSDDLLSIIFDFLERNLSPTDLSQFADELFTTDSAVVQAEVILKYINLIPLGARRIELKLSGLITHLKGG